MASAACACTAGWSESMIDVGAKYVLITSSILHFQLPDPASMGGLDIHQKKNL
jgi:hypothetical protein